MVIVGDCILGTPCVVRSGRPTSPPGVARLVRARLSVDAVELRARPCAADASHRTAGEERRRPWGSRRAAVGCGAGLHIMRGVPRWRALTQAPSACMALTCAAAVATVVRVHGDWDMSQRDAMDHQGSPRAPPSQNDVRPSGARRVRTCLCASSEPCDLAFLRLTNFEFLDFSAEPSRQEVVRTRSAPH